jgi:hypothetical protein
MPGRKNSTPANAAHDPAVCIALSFIRTVTVGFGIKPNLLTPACREEGQALAG